jgi:glycosyltransferase involved in cell wall biosynthesis
LEPFCGVSVEAQLCGTPVIAHDYGGMVETVEQFKTGLLCHTLGEICTGVKMALDGTFDRAYVRERAVKLFDMYKLARRYEYAFKTILEIPGPNNGWFSPENHLHCLRPAEEQVPNKPLHIALLLQGSIQHWNTTFPKFRKYIRHTNTLDIFLGHNTELMEDLTEFTKTCKPVSIVEEPIRYTHNYAKYPGQRSDVNLHSMIVRFLNRQRVFQNFEQYASRKKKQYDFVVSCFVNTEFLDFVRFDCLPTNQDTVFIPIGDDWGGLNYFLAYGTPTAMKPYMNLYSNLIPMLERKCIPHPETLMKQHAHDQSIHVVRSNVPYRHI